MSSIKKIILLSILIIMGWGSVATASVSDWENVLDEDNFKSILPTDIKNSLEKIENWLSEKTKFIDEQINIKDRLDDIKDKINLNNLDLNLKDFFKKIFDKLVLLSGGILEFIRKIFPNL